jgi:hypothetical protein
MSTSTDLGLEFSYLGPEDVPGLLNRVEREVATLLLDRGIRVAHEPYQFIAPVGGVLRTTTPDFYVENPLNPRGSGTFIEVTLHPSRLGNDEDPKERQRSVMEANGVRYVVLYRDHLMRIQAMNPNFDLSYSGGL